MRRNAILGILGALVVGAIALVVGGGWGIVILEAGGVVLLLALFIASVNRDGDNDVAG